MSSNCPYCRHELSTVATADGKKPRPADFTMCVHCGSWLVFSGDLSLRKTNQWEDAELTVSPEAQYIHDSWVRWQRTMLGAKLQ